MMSTGYKYRRNRFIGRVVLGVATVGVLTTAIVLKVHSEKEPDVSSQTASATLLTVGDLNEELIQSSMESMSVHMVAAVEEEVEQEQEASPYDGRFVANVTDTLNVRMSPSTDSEIVGKMYPGCAGEIVATEGEWTQITSGNVAGYVKTEFILTGKDAEPLAEEYGKYVGTVTGDILNIRKEANTEAGILGSLVMDEEVYVLETLDGWYKVLVDERDEGYVSAEFLSVEYKLDTAVTLEEEKARLEAIRQREMEEAIAATLDRQVSVETTQVAPTQLSYDDAYLLACLVSMEAGNEPYEGQLAVANVVLNRLRSGYYGSTISDVIYAPGQFPTVNGSVMVGFLNNGPMPLAQQAANEALAGVNNIGGYTGFVNVRYANYGAYSSYTIIGNHCFH